MPRTKISDGQPDHRFARDIADTYVKSLLELDPLLATKLGLSAGTEGLPDLSPEGQAAKDELARSTLAQLPSASDIADIADGNERRCMRLLRERLTAGLELSELGEHLCAISNIAGPAQKIRDTFMIMPVNTVDDWSIISRRMSAVDQALAGYRKSLDEGVRRNLIAAPRQVDAVIGQLNQWIAAADGRGWFAHFIDSADVPESLAADLAAGATSATAAVVSLRDWLQTSYRRRSRDVPEGVGVERYLASARYWTGATIDLKSTYDWAWSEYQALLTQMRSEACLVTGSPYIRGAVDYLNANSEVAVGENRIRQRLRQVIAEAIQCLDGNVFSIAEPLKTVEVCLAPAGVAAAPYYTPPSQDFSRPGRTWLPTLGASEFPLWNLITVWHHEGVPGHHLHLGQWAHLAERLSTFQTSVGAVSACTEGWALYAERLMDELGYLSRPGARLGYLDSQQMRTIRVIIDIGMHLRYKVPSDSPIGASRTWSPELARDFFSAHSVRDDSFINSEISRYLSTPGQAISYKLGERAWLAGRTGARSKHRGNLDLRSWHMASLSLGSLGLDDLTEELATA